MPVYLRDLREEPSWLLFLIGGRMLTLRRLHRRLSAGYAPQDVPTSTVLAPLDLAVLFAALAADGIAVGVNLSPETAAAIRRFADTTACFGNFDRRLEFLPAEHAAAEQRFGRPVLVAHYFDRLAECAAAQAVAGDPMLREIASRHLAAPAQVISHRLWWSFRPARVEEAMLHLASQERFHYDLNDWRSLKFFFYLTDVDAASGAHVYVRGSHRKRRFRHQLSPFVGQTTHEILATYGADRLLRIAGPAGTGFAEDPFGFHMGTVTAGRPRLILEVEFGISRPTPRRFYGEQVF
jgi:hypothetical protein